MRRLSSCRQVGVATALLSVGVLAVAAAVAGDADTIKVDRNLGVNQPAMFVPDEFIVVLTADARRNIVVAKDRAGAPAVNLPSLQDVIGRNGVTRFGRQFPTAQPQAAGSKFHDLTGYYKAKISAPADLEAVMAAFARDPNVDHVEKIGIHPIYSCATGTPRTPNDTYFDNPPPTFDWPQWDLWDANGIDADLAWNIETGDPTVIVVGMDSGVRYFHADLGGPDPPGPDDNVTNGNVWVNPFEIPGNGIDDEGNGYVDDVVGWDFVTGNPSFCASGEDCDVQDNDPRDYNGHGTHTAGTMAAITNNASGIAGIAGGWGDGTTGSPGNGSRIMCLRIGWHSPFGGFVRMDFAAQAMNYVTDMKNRGVNVAAVNASWGSSNSGGIDAAVDNLLAADVMLIHAAGNDNSSSPDYLGSKAGVLNVAASDKNGNKASFSNYGSWVDIAAPGVDIISTYHNYQDPANDYVAVMDGTSMSAPHVTGVAALLESCDPGLSGPDKFNLLVNNTCPAGSPNIGGILNAKLALDAAGCGGGCTGDPDCDDGNVCNGAETCDLGTGTCQPGTPLDCDDGDACTTDSCDPAAGCQYAPVDCDDGDPCTADSCVPTTGCINDPISPCCGDGLCELGEDCTTCSADCISGGGTPGCGNGICEAGEDCINCASDCRGKQKGKPSNQYCCSGTTGGLGGNNPVDCSDPRCSEQGYACGSADPYCCGNAICEGAEDQCNCEVDCGAPAGSEVPFATCTDGLDNDCDGTTDCNDTDCDTDPACVCGAKGDPCTIGTDCCSGVCKRNGTCR